MKISLNIIIQSSSEARFMVSLIVFIIMIMFVLIIGALLTLSRSQTAVSPTWNHDPNFQAGTSTLVSSPISNPFTNIYYVSFLTPTSSNPPYLAIGLKSY